MPQYNTPFDDTIKRRPFIKISGEPLKALTEWWYKTPGASALGRDRLYKMVQEVFKDKPDLLEHYTRRALFDFISNQEVYQKLVKPKSHSSIRPIISLKPFSILQIDLFDMQRFPSNGYVYVLNCLDIASRYCWCIPLKKKELKNVEDALVQLFAKVGKSPTVISKDGGGEFKFSNEWLARNGIKTQLTGAPHRPESQGLVERNNSIIKKGIFAYFLTSGKRNWTAVLQKIVDFYNNSEHSGLKSTPAKAWGNEDIIAEANSKRRQKFTQNNPAQPFFKFGDKVRLVLPPDLRGKFKSSWSDKIYTIGEVFQNKYKITYYSLIGKPGQYSTSQLLRASKSIPSPVYDAPQRPNIDLQHPLNSDELETLPMTSRDRLEHRELSRIRAPRVSKRISRHPLEFWRNEKA